MGWKNIKEHYKIGHLMHKTRDGNIQIGSPYISDLITVYPNGGVKIGRLGIEDNKELQRYVDEMVNDVDKLVELYNTPDKFEKSIPVYYYDDNRGEIITTYCEEFGWPNNTHDGLLMYSTYFDNIDDLLEYEKPSFERILKYEEDMLENTKKELIVCENNITKYKNILEYLENERTKRNKSE